MLNEGRVAKLRSLRQATLTALGDCPADLRAAILSKASALTKHSRASTPPLPPEVEAFTKKIVFHSNQTTDADITVLRDSGYSEDAILGIIHSASLGAGIARFEQVARALDQEVPLEI